MLRRIYLALAACLSLAAGNFACGQDAPNNNPPPSATDSSAPAGDDVAALKAENAALKKENADARQTIAQLQAQLAQAGITHPVATDGTDTPTSTTPSVPPKALPLDATNAVTNPAAPGAPAADAGPTKTYTVVKGDSLWKIAHKMYPHDTKNGVDKLQEANKDAIGGKPLKIGQVLVVPQ